MLVFDFVGLDHTVGLQHRVAFDLDHLVDEGLHDSDPHVIVGCLLLVVNRDEVQVNDKEDSLDLKIRDHFLQDFAQFK